MRGPLVTLGLLLAVTWIGGGYLLYTVLRDDDTMTKKAAAQSVQLADAARKYAQLQTEAAALNQQLQATKSDLRHPTLGIWSSDAKIADSTVYLTGGVPDAFTYHLKFTADGPISVNLLTTSQFADAIACAKAGHGDLHACLSRTGRGWPGVTNLNEDIHEAEGCADYLVIFTAARAATIHPDVSVTYNPARAATGACAG